MVGGVVEDEELFPVLASSVVTLYPRARPRLTLLIADPNFLELEIA